MEKFNIADLEDYQKPRYVLQVKHGSLQNAARKMNMSKFKLSRIVNGEPHLLEDHIKVLQYMGILEGLDYSMPRMDMETFLKLNAPVINNKLRAELLRYNPVKIRKEVKPGTKEDLNWPHKQSELFPELQAFNKSVKKHFPDLKKVARSRKK